LPENSFLFPFTDFEGGRTAASVLLAELSEEMIEAGYKISYYDFNSLVNSAMLQQKILRQLPFVTVSIRYGRLR
jgi:hypothetical protein